MNPEPSSASFSAAESAPDLQRPPCSAACARITTGRVLTRLLEEHRRIGIELERLEEIARLELGDLVLSRRLKLLDEVHHIAWTMLSRAREHRRAEEILFSALTRRGLRRPPARLLVEHGQLDDLERRLQESALHALQNHGQGWSETMRTLGDLTRLLRAHVREEDEVLFPLAFELAEQPSTLELEGCREAVVELLTSAAFDGHDAPGAPSALPTTPRF